MPGGADTEVGTRTEYLLATPLSTYYKITLHTRRLTTPETVLKLLAIIPFKRLETKIFFLLG